MYKNLIPIATLIVGFAANSFAAVSDNFDSYVDQTAFNAAWTPSGTAMTLDSTLSLSAPNSITQGTVAQQSRMLTAGVSGSNLEFKFDLYDPAGNNSGRSYGMAYSRAGTDWTGSLNQIIAVGRYNNATTTKYYARVAFATGATYTDGATATTGGWLTLGGAADTSIGWHSVQVIGSDDPLNSGKIQLSFYIDNILGGTVGNVTKADFNWAVMGSGTTSTGAGASFDNVSLAPAPVPEPSTIALGLLGGAGLMAGYIRRRAKK